MRRAARPQRNALPTMHARVMTSKCASTCNPPSPLACTCSGTRADLALLVARLGERQDRLRSLQQEEEARRRAQPPDDPYAAVGAGGNGWWGCRFDWLCHLCQCR